MAFSSTGTIFFLLLLSLLFFNLFAWKVVTPIGSKFPSVRYSHCAGVLSDRYYITHGYYYDHTINKPIWLDDTWQFRIENKSWIEVVMKGDVPVARYGAACVVWNDKLFMHGGDAGNKGGKVALLNENLNGLKV